MTASISSPRPIPRVFRRSHRVRRLSVFVERHIGALRFMVLVLLGSLDLVWQLVAFRGLAGCGVVLRSLDASISRGLLIDLCRLGFHVLAIVILAARGAARHTLVTSPVALLPDRLVPASCPLASSLALLTHFRLHSISPLVLLHAFAFTTRPVAWLVVPSYSRHVCNFVAGAHLVVGCALHACAVVGCSGGGAATRAV